MDLDQFVAEYTNAALWSSPDDSGEPLDRDHTANDLANETRETFANECRDFLALLESEHLDVSAIEPRQIAHDFWLTRNGHGAGFWDRGLGELGDKLTSAAMSYGAADLYIGDDGLIYQS